MENSKLERFNVYVLGYCVVKDSASIAMLQRLMKIGYAKASNAIDWLEANGYISEFNGQPRKVLISLSDYKMKFTNYLKKEGLFQKKYEKQLLELLKIIN